MPPSLLILLPIGEGPACSGRHKKTPTLGDWGQSRSLTTFPSKVLPARKSAGFLACGMRLLSAPSQGRQPQWSSQISFRLQLRGSAGLTPASLVTGIPCDNLTFVISIVGALYYGTYYSAVNVNPRMIELRSVPVSSGDGAASHAPRDTPSHPDACRPSGTTQRTHRSSDSRT